MLFHIPNEGKRSLREGANLKKAGLKKGVPDLFLPVPRGEYHGLFIEMKRVDGKAREEQQWWINRLIEEGYYAVVCCGWKRAATILVQYMEYKGGHAELEAKEREERERKKAEKAARKAAEEEKKKAENLTNGENAANNTGKETDEQ